MAPNSNKKPAPSGNMGLKAFNQVGQEEGTTEILRPKVSAAVRQQAIVLIAIVVVLIGVVGFMAFQRSGLPLIPKEDANGKTFNPGERPEVPRDDAPDTGRPSRP